LSGRQTSFLQFLSLNFLRPIRLSNEDGNSFKGVPLKSSLYSSSMVSMTSGKISNLEQPSRSNVLRDFNL
ncbi:hypothetical protein ERO13_A11G282656v2, partial [Gossypium hirsutum]